MDWWKKALATFSSTAIFFWGVHFWNESYRKVLHYYKEGNFHLILMNSSIERGNSSNYSLARAIRLDRGGRPEEAH